MPTRPRDLPTPPSHLSDETRDWWERLVQDYDFTAGELKLLRLACEAWDEGQRAREAVEEHGAVYADRFGQPRARPEVAISRDARTAFSRLLRELNLDAAAAGEPGRPPRIANRYQRT